MRSALSLPNDKFVTDVGFSQIPDLDEFIRPQFDDDVLTGSNGLGFFQRNGPPCRRIVILIADTSAVTLSAPPHRRGLFFVQRAQVAPVCHRLRELFCR